jgi:CRP/FNR family cyclic AMP-dependent transcriptional regulator
LANAKPPIWRALAVELCRRLDARKKFHRTPNKTARIFIGSSRESLPLARAYKTSLEGVAKTKRLKVSVTIWNKGVFGASAFPVESLEAQLGLSDFAVLVADKDDKVTSRGKRSDAPRDNVVFELGLFMGALGRARTFLLVPRGVKLKIPSDLLGLTPLDFDPTTSSLGGALLVPARELVDIIADRGPK